MTSSSNNLAVEDTVAAAVDLEADRLLETTVPNRPHRPMGAAAVHIQAVRKRSEHDGKPTVGSVADTSLRQESAPR